MLVTLFTDRVSGLLRYLCTVCKEFLECQMGSPTWVFESPELPQYCIV